MSQPSADLQEYVYRRVAPPAYRVKSNELDADAFLIRRGMTGLSVFRADLASPYAVLNECIEDFKRRLLSHDDNECARAAMWLKKNPDVETLVGKDFRVVAIPIVAINELGFTRFDGPEPNGHINILGTVDEFKARSEQFVNLVDTGRAWILSAAECLKRPDSNF